MARKHEAVEWLKKGYPPSKIAKEMRVTVSTVVAYLYNQVGEGRIRRSDIVFSVDQNTRDTIERFISKTGGQHWYDIYREIRKSGTEVDQDDLRIYLVLRDARVALGDMYEIIRDIEVTLHSAIKNILVSEYGSNWWKRGIPEKISIDCVASLERNPESGSEAYRYTNFIHLKEILRNQWNVFSKALPKRLSSDKKTLLSDLTRLNRIRNSVMHPVRGAIPTDKDFAFVRELRDHLELARWKGEGKGSSLDN